MDRSSAFRRIAIFFGVAFWVFALLSLASFHAEDPPAHSAIYSAKPPIHNLCGPVGAVLAYYCYLLIGQGIFIILFCTGLIMVMRLLKHRLSDMWLRVIGMVLVSVAFAAFLHQISRGSIDGFPEGNGGVLGLATSNFLEAKFNKAGSLIVLALSFMVGLVLAADEIVARTPAVVGAAAGKAYQAACKLPKPKFELKLPDFFGRKSSDAVEEAALPKPILTSHDAKPQPRKEAEPNAFEGLARVLTDEEEQSIAKAPPALPAAPAPTPSPLAQDEFEPLATPANGYVLPEKPIDFAALRARRLEQAAANEIASPADAPVITPDTKQIEFQYDLDTPAEPAPPAAAEAAHVDADDPPPAAAVVIPAPVQTNVDQPLTDNDAAAGATAPQTAAAAPKPAIVVRMPGTVAPRRTAPAPLPQELGDYSLPGWNLLGDAEAGYRESQEAYVRDKAQVLEQSLREFGIDAQVVEINTGPVITMYEISMAPGTKVAQITALTNDIARSLAAVNVRIVAPVPGKNTVGIEVPNAQKEKVRLKELMQLTTAETQAKMTIPLFLGKDANGEPLVADLASMPHCLIAGTTGSGKSVCINTIIMSIMYTQRPDHVKLVLFDPKVVEMAPYKSIPHLMCDVITETGKAASVLEWACEKMDERYSILNEAQVRNIAGYNKLTKEELYEKFGATTDEEKAKVPKHMPYIVIVIDELADLMMTAGKEVESSIIRIAQKARAVGIHLILATQRPQATVVTGLIKANMPCKIAFRVASKMDSRIVLDQNGAELLLGQGDMLYLANGANKPMRSQGTFIDDKEIRESVNLVAANARAQYEPELMQLKGTVSVEGEAAQDDLFDEAVRVVLESQRGSVSLLQRKLNIGYGRASRLIELMAGSGILGDYKGSQAREVMLTLEDWDNMKKQQQDDADSGMSV